MRLSEFELDVLAHFWKDGALSAPALFERMGHPRGVTYSTVKTIIDRLEKKGAIRRTDNSGRTILYSAAVSQASIRKPLVKSFVRRMFGNDLRPLFAQLLRNEKLSGAEVEYLKSLLKERK